MMRLFGMQGPTRKTQTNPQQQSKTSQKSQIMPSFSTTSQTEKTPRWSTEKATEWTGGSGKQYTPEKMMNQDEGSYQISYISDGLPATVKFSYNQKIIKN